jgi:hypothetical protein
MYVRVQRTGQVVICDTDGRRVDSGTLIDEVGNVASGVSKDAATAAGLKLLPTRKLAPESVNKILRAIALELEGTK